MNLTPVDIVDIILRLVSAIAGLVRRGASKATVLAAVKHLESHVAQVDADVDQLAAGQDPRGT